MRIELLEVETAIESDAHFLYLEQELQGSVSVPRIEREYEELDQTRVLQLVQREVIVQVLFDEDENFASQVLVLQHDHLSQRRQRVLLQHVLRVGRHGQVVLKLHRSSEDLVHYSQRQDALADIERVPLEVPAQLVRNREIDHSFKVLMTVVVYIDLFNLQRSLLFLQLFNRLLSLHWHVLRVRNHRFGRRCEVFENQVHAVVEHMEALGFDQELHVGLGKVLTDRERDEQELKEQEMHMGVLWVLDQLQPVWNGFHLVD